MIERIGFGKRAGSAIVKGGTVYVSGQVAERAAGASVGEQTREVLDLIDGLLRQAGSDKSKITMANVYLSDFSGFGEMNEVWHGWAPAGRAPARATVEAKLAGPQYAVEVAVIASI